MNTENVYMTKKSAVATNALVRNDFVRSVLEFHDFTVTDEADGVRISDQYGSSILYPTKLTYDKIWRKYIATTTYNERRYMDWFVRLLNSYLNDLHRSVAL